MDDHKQGWMARHLLHHDGRMIAVALVLYGLAAVGFIVFLIPIGD